MQSMSSHFARQSFRAAPLVDACGPTQNVRSATRSKMHVMPGLGMARPGAVTTGVDPIPAQP